MTQEPASEEFQHYLESDLTEYQGQHIFIQGEEVVEAEDTREALRKQVQDYETGLIAYVPRPGTVIT